MLRSSYIPGSSFFQDNFTYDSLNRLTSISEKTDGTGNNTFKQGYLYDRWGNRRIDAANTLGTGINNLGYGVDPENNRLTAPAGYQAPQYDSAGNLTQDPTSQNPTATSLYDAENRLSKISFPGSNQPIQYVYDADGRRVRRVSAAQYIWQVYGMDGELLAEYYAGQFVGGVEQPVPVTNILFQKEYGYRAGQLLITASSGDDNRIDRFINNFYYAALGRQPSATELSQQHAAFIQAAQQGQSQLLAAAQTLGQQLFDLSNPSSEYNQRNRSDEEFVTDLYFAYLQRPPDEGGLGYFLWQLQNGVTRVQVRDGFASSAEFVALASTLYGANNEPRLERVFHYLSGMYLAVPGNGGDFGADLGTLQEAAAEGQTQVIQAAQTIGTNLFQPWVEDKGENITDEQFAAGLFHAFLQREPSQSDMEKWIQTVQGEGRAQAVQEFAALTATQELAGTLYREILWLTPDHLGTPHMISERSGSLAGIKRHDYLPFGEEIYAGTGGRSAPQGYVGDTVRQQFTQKERDNETGLDYFGARYYASTQGRFTTVDPLLLSAKLADPQSWNRYAYVGNNPLKFIDQLGLYKSPAFNCSEGNNACLNDEQRTILNDSTIEVAGKKLSGEGLYNALSEKQQNAFVNITDKLASIKLDDGSTALSQVSSVSGIKSDRILANVSNSLASSLESSNQFKSVPAGDHKPFDATSFKDTNSTFGNIQLSFNASRRGADIDIDIGNVVSGDVAGPVVHLGEVIMNKISRTTTNQDSVRKILIRDPKIQTITPSPDPKFNRKEK